MLESRLSSPSRLIWTRPSPIICHQGASMLGKHRANVPTICACACKPFRVMLIVSKTSSYRGGGSSETLNERTEFWGEVSIHESMQALDITRDVARPGVV